MQPKVDVLPVIVHHGHDRARISGLANKSSQRRAVVGLWDSANAPQPTLKSSAHENEEDHRLFKNVGLSCEDSCQRA